MQEILTLASAVGLMLCLIPFGYLLLLALSSIRQPPKTVFRQNQTTRFLVVIPAHDEESVIAATVRQILASKYPGHLLKVHVIADHCSDRTVLLAKEAGAVVHERKEDAMSGKGAALSWFLERVLEDSCDAVVVLDADTKLDANFLKVMDTRMFLGHSVVQGKHVISNPDDGWFPLLTWSMFRVDNRFQNLGRSNLGWSAKHMGDSICFQTQVLKDVGWGEGLTEDHQMRQRMLLKGIKIVYEPDAIGYGEAPREWRRARKQRERWLRGTGEWDQRFVGQMLIEAARRRSSALLDGALQVVLPSFSTIMLVSFVVSVLHVLVNVLIGPILSWNLVLGWLILVGSLGVYPFLGLFIDRAPLKAYLAMIIGPFYIVWRSWLSVAVRRKEVTWIRTSHGE